MQQDGITNLSVKMTGWMNGGVQQKILKKAKPVSDLGSKKDLKNLIQYAKDNHIDMYLNGITDYAYDSNLLNGFWVFTDAARFVSKDKVEIYPYSTVIYGEREGQEPHYLLKASLASQMADNLVKAANKYDANVSFEEIGMELNSDYNRKETVSRQQVLNSQTEKLKAIRDSGMKVMINMGNNYAVPYSNIVTNMDLNGSEYSIIDATAPVYQIAVHGYINYTGESLNMAQNYQEELLLAAEYGAGLSFTLMDESVFTLQNTLYTQYFGVQFDAWHDKLVDIYSRYNKELGHTFSQSIIHHEMITDKLSCTEYEDGTKVYVNFSYDEAKTPQGDVVPSRDYLVIR